MKLSKIVLIMMLISVVLLTSCSKDDENPTEPDNGGTQGNTNNSGQPMPAFADNSAGVMATISYEFEAAPGLPAVQLSLAFAQFENGTDAGNVSVNNNALGKTSQGGTTFYIVPSPTNPTQTLSGVSFDGSNHSWTVSGAGSVPQLNGSVASPSNFSVSSPANNSSVNKAGDLTVNWTNTSANSRVLIVLAALDNSGQYYAEEDLNDSGSFTIPSSELSSFSGDAMLQVVKYNYSSVNSGGSDYYIISEIVKSITIKIN